MINQNTHVCIEHFEQAMKHHLLLDEYPSLHLPFVSTSLKRMQRKPPKEHFFAEMLQDSISGTFTSESATEDAVSRDTSTQTNISCVFVEQKLAAARHHIAARQVEVKSYKEKLEKQKFSSSNMADDDKNVAFYNGFQSFGELHPLYRYLGPAVENLFYTA